ncbi:MAG: hypothetical protein ABH830_03110 [Patescibacteria group bacterium]
MYAKFFINLFFLIILIIIQLAFINGLPGWFNKLNLVLIILIYILSFKDLKIAIFWTIGAGFLLDAYSFLPFGFYVISLFLSILLADFLLINFFTNRSLYSFLAITFFSLILYEIILNLLIIIWQFFISKVAFFLFLKEFWLNLSIRLLINLIFVFILFYLINFVSLKLKPVFLIKAKP